MLKIVRIDGLALLDAGNEIINDPEVVLEAISQNDKAFIYASKDLQENKLIALAAVKKVEMYYLV